MIDRKSLNRRTLVQGSAATALGLGAIGTSSLARRAAAQDPTVVTWWEHFPEGLNMSVRDAYMEANPDVTIELTLYAPNEMNQALQLAYQSEQMPDITTTPGAAGSSIQNLVREGWFQPLPNGDAIREALPPDSLVDGISVFDGEVYSFPIFSFRQYATLNWFNTELMESAGVDPETGPATWDEFRQAAAAITEQGGGQIYGWIQGINFPDRMEEHLNDLAQAAGAPGGIDHLTGEYQFTTDPYINALEFLVSLQQDGLLFPASTGLDARNARARWYSGVAGMFFDGPWNAGVLNQDVPEFLEQVNVAAIPVPDAGTESYLHRAPSGGTYWVAAQSENIDVVSDLLVQLTTPEYYVMLAERMDQPPLNLDAVAEAEVHPTYQKSIESFESMVRLAPSPVARNPAVADVLAEMRPVEPALGVIVQGAFSGDVTDFRAVLQQYNDQMTAERDRAIQVVQDAGGEVSIDDWIFADWVAGEDYAGETTSE